MSPSRPSFPGPSYYVAGSIHDPTEADSVPWPNPILQSHSVKTKQSIAETNTKAVKQTLRPICPSRLFETFPGPRTIFSSVVVHCHCQCQCLAVTDATADKPSPRSRHRPKLADPESRSTPLRPPFKLDELAHGFRKLEGRPT
ncbi:protein phosphatase 2C [Colletotrichum acutatum]